MKQLFTILILITFVQILGASDNEEFRATWVITWEHIQPNASAEANKSLARSILDNHAEANMNAVLWQARQSGTAYFNSSYEPWGSQAGSSYPGYDPLAYAVEQAHARGMELHAWFNVFRSDANVPGAPAYEHPEWVCRDNADNPMTSNRTISPGLPEVREYLVNVAMEIVRNYDIDGLHLDYVRWSEFTNSQTSQQLAKNIDEKRQLDGMISQEQIDDIAANPAGRYLYDHQHPYSAGVPDGFSNWESWWRWSVTEFVRVLHDSIQSVKPWVRLSPAALGNYNWGGWNGYNTVYQDAALWFNEGYIDQLTPMHYHWTTSTGFLGMLQNNCPSCWKQYIQPGINDGRLFSAGPGSYQFANKNTWGRHPGVVEAVRTVDWVDGFQFFSYGSWQLYKYWEEAGETFFGRKTKMRATKLIVDAAPDSPTIDLAKIDSLNYQIDVTPAASITENHWYAIYRSEDDIPEVETDVIVDIHYGMDAYSFTDQFSGLQDYNSIYHYFATTLDRFWNESSVSSTMQSDPIFSAVPVVLSTTPAQGDTIPVNSSVTINFSKKMDSSTLQSGISFVPLVNIGTFELSADGKSLTVKPESNFEFAAEYALTVAPTVTDVNGKQLDGNADGIEGDPFVLNFSTLAVDDTGPNILISYPDIATGAEDFVIDEVISIVFDELVDANSIGDSTLKLLQDDYPVEFGHKVTTVKDMSVLCVQSMLPLESDQDYMLLVTDDIADTTGNKLASEIAIPFSTVPVAYEDDKDIDKFLSLGAWENPDYSGSTTGIYAPNTTFEVSTAAYLPASSARQRTSAALTYEWDESASTFLLREYMSNGAPRSVEFDTSWTLQVHLFGDGSGNKFRFAVDEGSSSQWKNHEVSQWTTIDWYGWRLVEWKMSDPGSVGQWIGNQVMDGAKYRIDSFQMTHENGASSTTGTVYFDNLKLVKKMPKYIGVEDNDISVTRQYTLLQNYPNPFNPTTSIPFVLDKSGHVKLTVYNILGRKINTLIDEHRTAGYHEVIFDAIDFSSGTYFSVLEFESQILKRRMILLK